MNFLKDIAALTIGWALMVALVGVIFFISGGDTGVATVIVGIGIAVICALE
jgi:hypothetical protein